MDFTRLRGTQVPHDQNENIKHAKWSETKSTMWHIYSASISAMKYRTMSSVLDKCNTVAMYFNPSPTLFFRIKVPLKNIHFGSGKINIFKSARNYFIGYIVLICYMHIGNKNAPLFVIFRNIKIKTIWFFLHISAMVSVFLSLFGVNEEQQNY